MAATMSLVGAFSQAGFRLGLVVAAFLFGFRHGIDWDHIAAITDITSSQEDRRKSLLFGTVYALGHALVVLALGVVAIVIGKKLPTGVDRVMTRVVGATLIVLGIYVFTSLIRHGRDFRMRSRWMLIFAGVRRGARWWTGRREAEPAPVIGGGSVETLTPERAGNASSWHHAHHGLPGHHPHV